MTTLKSSKFLNIQNRKDLNQRRKRKESKFLRNANLQRLKIRNIKNCKLFQKIEYKS